MAVFSVFLFLMWTGFIIFSAPGVLVLAAMSTDAPSSDGSSIYIIFFIAFLIAVLGYYLIYRITVKE